jgi:hypothetical protein
MAEKNKKKTDYKKRIKNKCMENSKVEGEGSEKEDISVSEIKSISEEHQIRAQKMLMCLSGENC